MHQISLPSGLQILHGMRNAVGERQTLGLTDAEIVQFLSSSPELNSAIVQAYAMFEVYMHEFSEVYPDSSESELLKYLQSGYINFYKEETVNPYIALSACGPWVITSHGAVLHDNGGYGMLGFGHAPSQILDEMSKPWVMANVMTASFSQKKLEDHLRKELGHKRGSCPFSQFICMNSGSESVTVALRLSDVNAKLLTQKGGSKEGHSIKMMAMVQGFHGRTDRPAQISHSCKSSYDAHLASFQNRDNLILIPSNDISALRQAFADAERNKVFVELLAIEPVQGEGNPGECVSREFYDEARRLTLEHGTLLLIDSIQAGFRGQGVLSVTDYEGFEDCIAPDLETWSKALNAGQYPLSVLGLNSRASSLYVKGIYGNTMTTNPRALETAIAVLEQVTPELRKNIVVRGLEFKQKLDGLQHEFPHIITKVQGTGLLCSVELEPTQFPVIGFDGVETWCRKRGLGVIHGGKNALRFTSHFSITSEEIKLITDILREALLFFSN